MGAISHDSALQAQELADSLGCQAISEVFRASRLQKQKTPDFFLVNVDVRCISRSVLLSTIWSQP